MSYEYPWLYEDKIFDSDDIKEYYGFVYEITNVLDDRKYIGKKFFWFKKIKSVKGKKKRYLAESDWKTYYGSSKELQADIEKLGFDCFDRKILRLCKNKSECAYYELKEQIDREVLLSEDYYNNFISVKLGGRNLTLNQ